jgi:hypothetical protein
VRIPRFSLILVPIGVVLFLIGLYSHQLVPTSFVGAAMAVISDTLSRLSSGCFFIDYHKHPADMSDIIKNAFGRESGILGRCL